MRHPRRRPALLALALLLALLTPTASAATTAGPTRVIAHDQDAAPLGRLTARPVDHGTTTTHSPDADTADRLPQAAATRGGRVVVTGTVPPYPAATSATVRGPPRS